jgi:N6-L-threonylcarbamoyladenine synthase
LHSQIELYALYGGVKIWFASRDHIRKLVRLCLMSCLSSADVKKSEIDAIAYTKGPWAYWCLNDGCIV